MASPPKVIHVTVVLSADERAWVERKAKERLSPMTSVVRLLVQAAMKAESDAPGSVEPRGKTRVSARARRSYR